MWLGDYVDEEQYFLLIRILLDQRYIDDALELLARLQTSIQPIAQRLVVAPGTVKAHAASIYRKLYAANRTEVVARAQEIGILPLFPFYPAHKPYK